MWFLALAAPSAVFVLALATLRRRCRRPLALLAPLALSLTICFEAALLNVLSAFHAVARGPLLATHAAVATAWAFAIARSLPRLPTLRWRALYVDVLAVLAFVALAVPVAYSALAYVPNNWDSMTYHLARVAHWIQHGSVGVYETNVSRQSWLTPGAEYLLLVLQAIGGTDRLANLVQFVSWLVIAIALGPLARLFGAPRRIAPWAALIFAAAPMALLQASSTQNDLVASIAALGIVIACLPFLHARPRWFASDVGITAAAISAGVLVKPTAVVVTLPFITWAAIALGRGIIGQRRRLRVLASGVLAAAAVGAALVGPEWSNRGGAADHGEFSQYLYRPFSLDRDRLTNAVRGLGRHVSLPSAWTDALAGTTTLGCDVPHSMCAERLARPHEDAAGNPLSALLIAGLILTAIWRWRALPPRAIGAVGAVTGSWVVFAAVFRDNAWIARLHLPMFALAPLSAAALAGAPARRWLRPAALVVGVVLSLEGVRAASRNELRPAPNPVYTSLGLLPATYYAARLEQWGAHVRAMTVLSKTGCNRLGLFIGGDSYDYPLTWRAMQRGIEVRHVVRPDDWPCVVYSDQGAPPGDGWIPAEGAPEIFVRAQPSAAANEPR